ncbi:MAG: two-component system chemotaxis response regulator CheY [Myxococcota bacterium]|jgi:two-component system chemotaxis response regulator CheY
MKVLIVDDSRVMRMIVRRALRQTGADKMEFKEAENGTLGLEAAQTYKPDLILADWNMPGMSGIEFLAKVRELGMTTPFGLVTSEGSAVMRAIAIREGADFLIQKPFQTADFSAILHHVQ